MRFDRQTMGKTTYKPSRSSRIAWKPLVCPENGTKPLASSNSDKAQSGNAVGTTRWSGTHVTSLKRRALSWVRPGLIPLAKDARKSQLMTEMSDRCLQKYPDKEKLQKSQKGQRVAAKSFKGWRNVEKSLQGQKLQ
ncbi:hypothetical protein Taro_029943, partial [Colocasia esculenta]|nr:hypothetical protein [Colocasia esculenta]